MVNALLRSSSTESRAACGRRRWCGANDLARFSLQVEDTSDFECLKMKKRALDRWVAPAKHEASSVMSALGAPKFTGGHTDGGSNTPETEK
jgi:hypothetical protein